MVHGKNRIPYRIDRRLTGLAGPDYDAPISFGLPLEPEDSQYGKSRLKGLQFSYQWVVNDGQGDTHVEDECRLALLKPASTAVHATVARLSCGRRRNPG